MTTSKKLCLAAFAAAAMTAVVAPATASADSFTGYACRVTYTPGNTVLGEHGFLHV